MDSAEAYLRSLGFMQSRVRCYGKLARIELLPENSKRVFTEDLNKAINDKLKEIGFLYVSMDLAGYRTESMNEAIGK